MNNRTKQLLWIVLLFTFSCSGKQLSDNAETSFDTIDTIVAVFVNENSVYPTVAYNSHYDQALLQDFAKSQQTPIKTIVVATQYIAKRMLAHDSAHIIAHPCVATLAMKADFQHHATHAAQKLVLIQSMGANAITNISKLQDDTIHALSQSAAFRAVNINQEIGGRLHLVMHHCKYEFDTLIAGIASGKHRYAIAHEQWAAHYKRIFPTLDTRIAVSFEQEIGWLTNQSRTQLNDALGAWWCDFPRWKMAGWRRRHLAFRTKTTLRTDSISPYDDFFKQYADSIAWDWRLLAAMAYQESRFSNERTSHKGAMGIMQIMPRTGEIYGLDSLSAFDPERNIATSAMHIEHLQSIFRKISDKTEQQYFVLAAYNGGASHVVDAMNLAKKYGRNPHVWFNNVEHFYKLKNDSSIYTDEVVKAGKTNTKESVNYVRSILKTYERFLR